MAGKSDPQVIVQYVTKYDGPPAPGCAEIALSVVMLVALAFVLGWVR